MWRRESQTQNCTINARDEKTKLAGGRGGNAQNRIVIRQGNKDTGVGGGGGFTTLTHHRWRLSGG